MGFKRGNLNIVQYLVNLGADFRAENNDAIENAFLNNHMNIVQYLFSLVAYHPNIIIKFD